MLYSLNEVHAKLPGHTKAADKNTKEAYEQKAKIVLLIYLGNISDERHFLGFLFI